MSITRSNLVRLLLVVVLLALPVIGALVAAPFTAGGGLHFTLFQSSSPGGGASAGTLIACSGSQGSCGGG
jgi:hypothetical protein